MADEGWSPADVDLTTPNTARIYDYLLGGKDNYAADREVAERLIEVIPEARTAARENHAFVGRAVRFLARRGLRQFIDVGRSEEHTSELQSRENLVCRLLLEKKKKNI